MRPLSFAERRPGQTVGLGELLTGSRPAIAGETTTTLADYTEEVLASGLPGLRGLPERPLRAQLDGYLHRIVDRDIPDDTGIVIRNPQALRRWMAAYAAATSTTTSWEKIRDAASPGQDHQPTKATFATYRDALSRVWALDGIDAWIPSTNALKELGQSPKHQLADPALAARLLGVRAATLLEGQSAGPVIPRDGTLLGALFEHLVGLSVQVYAAHNEAVVRHLRTARGRQEVDLIVVRDDGAVVAMEVKLARVVEDRDVKHLRWLRDQIGDQLLDAVVVSTGKAAYRRPDGIAVVPLALLGP